MLCTDSGSGARRALAEELGGEAVGVQLRAGRQHADVVDARPQARAARGRRARGAPAARAVVSLLARATLEELRAAYPARRWCASSPTPRPRSRRGVTLLAEPAEEPLAGQVEELFARVGIVVRAARGDDRRRGGLLRRRPRLLGARRRGMGRGRDPPRHPGRAAQRLVTETMAGSAELLRARGHDTLRLRREVTSPGGHDRARAGRARARRRPRGFAAAMDDVLGTA